MLVRFWGVRGSLPSPLSTPQVEAKIVDALLGAGGVDLTDRAAVEAYVRSLPLRVRGTYGGNTPCVEVRTAANDLLIFDAGSGIRSLGSALMQTEFGRGQGLAHLFFSHYHWDHLQGFPFFAPAFIPGNRFIVWSVDGRAEDILTRQQEEPTFPVPFAGMGATFEFHSLAPQTAMCDGRVRVTYALLDHPGTAYGYRVEADGTTFVYATDAEYKKIDEEFLAAYGDFFRDADLLLFDAQYSFAESQLDKRDWGHSSAAIGVEIAAHAGVKRLVLFHHDPRTTDDELLGILDSAQQYAALVPGGAACDILLAYEGLEVAL
ncbi:MAG: MBL fold metallo-hydrolase [Abditibacteriales bacterium]|nr:MBL fold metallo-hydrolase [Abditibacteriales bacterium]MDW8364583.1 MBL fold metallo-hydrolase [Abditibacteriales bacterium]